MGIVIKQSIQNTLSTYLGFGIGAVNTLFLYTHFLSDEFYGLVGFLLSAATIMSPLLSFGVHHTLIKFYSTYTNETHKTNFLSFMLFMPLFIIIPVGFIGHLSYEHIVSFLTKKNKIIENYVWYIYLIAIAMAYFEIFYAMAKVQMRSVFGNVMKEVFHRALIFLLLFGVYFKFVATSHFIGYLVLIYFLRLLVMKWVVFRFQLPKLFFSFPKNTSSILKYASLIVVAGSIALVLLDIDKVMIGKYIALENVAYYNVAIFIATVIIVPARAMHQITYPLTARLLNSKQWDELRVLYQKSSLTLFIVSGLVFLLIVLNIKQLYLILPEDYSGGLFVVLLISISKLLDNLMGINNAILYNSDYYGWTVIFGVLLAIVTIILNYIFIPLYGINGAALATVISLLMYSASKLMIINWKFKMHPFSKNTLFVFLKLLILFFGCFYWDFEWHPLLNIILKTILICALYLFIVIKLHLSEDINTLYFIVKQNLWK